MAHVSIGDYQLVQHLETPECSLRVLKLTKAHYVHSHHHHNTTQIYFVLEGMAKAKVAGGEIILQRHQMLRIPPDAIHSIRTDGEALVLSVSVPPLDASDQHVSAEH